MKRSNLGLVVAGLAVITPAALLLRCSSDPPATVKTDAGTDAASDVVVVPCDDQHPCSAPLACCSGVCADTKTPQHCGACNVACTKTQFCTGTACFDAVLKNVCENPGVAVVLDGIPVDEDAGGTVGLAMEAGCAPTVAVRSIPQGAPGTLADGGRPTLGVGDTYLAAGGPFGQQAVAYVQSARVAPIYTVGDATSLSFLRSSDNGLIKKALTTELTAHHDYFAVYLAPDPVTGTLVLALYGVYGPGTSAAAYFVKNQVMANRATFDKAYYVYEWTDGPNQDGLADPTDTVTLVASGP